jgi:hypothetical protein
MEPVKSSSSICSSLDDFVACAASPAKEVFFIDSLDDLATALADVLSWFV